MADQTVVLTAFQPAARTSASLCVGIVPLQQDSQWGGTARWAVGAWAEGGSVPDAWIQLKASAGAGVPTFSAGCGSGNGTSACDLGAVNAGAAQRELQAQVTVSPTATLTAVSLTVIGGAANLAMGPAASAAITVLVPASLVAANLSPLSTVAPLGVAAVFPPATTTLTAGGSAAGLFPTVTPSALPGTASGAAPAVATGEVARPVANTTTLAMGTPVGSDIAEGGGLLALGVAMLLAVTRVSWRRPAPKRGK